MVHVTHVHFMFFTVLNNLKSSFSEDNVPDHALDIFIENATKIVWANPIKRMKWRSNFKVAPKLCIFLCKAMEPIGVRQGMSIMFSGVMDTVFHSCDVLGSIPQNWVLNYPQFFVQNELNIGLC